MPDLPPLADRTRHLHQSDIRAVTARINAVGGINLGQGICDLPTPEAAKAGAKRAIDADESIYSSYAGIPALREQVLEKARAYNDLPAASVDEVMVGVGATGTFVTAALALLDPGDEVILFEPFYGYHRNILETVGAQVRSVVTRPPDWAIDLDALAAAFTQRTKAVVVCTPANPSGKVWTRDELAALMEMLHAHDAYAITDEIYEYMLYDGRAHVSLGSLPEAYARTVTISGLSKTYNMTGWRLGYAVAPAPIAEQMGLLNDLLYICAPTPLQHGGAAAFAMPPDYLREMRRAYDRRRTMMCEALEAAGFEVPWPQGAYYVLAGTEGLAAHRDGFGDDQQAARTVIEEAGVAAVPGHSFFTDPADGRHLLRFCFAKEEPVLERACTQLVEAFGR